MEKYSIKYITKLQFEELIKFAELYKETRYYAQNWPDYTVVEEILELKLKDWLNPYVIYDIVLRGFQHIIVYK